MSGPAKTALEALKKHVLASKSKMKKLVTDTAAANGTRAQPARTTTNDSSIGSRLDFGPLASKTRNFNFQLNKNASNSSVKKLAAKDSHKVWSTASVETDAKATDDQIKTKVEKLFKDLEKNMKDK
ncbi:hypothetical protein QBC42DRAFT_263582 [Cladorrhinum samala]|uniref:Uncharacterized protein n=1 Tax=Cladorrhinum samala TaxID=585594 RepID=A0AAV9HU63_9PEZI|nr:hypothetical protein QBC42DRAFT_263582 [Cladorrhinum samala]